MNLKKYFIAVIVLNMLVVGFSIPYPKVGKLLADVWNDSSGFIVSLTGPLVAGLVIWFLGEHVANKKIKQEAIRDLMTYRGSDYGSDDFRLSLNKIAIVFHSDSEIRTEVRHLYEVVNNQSLRGKIAERAIVSLIYKLCQRNGFKGLTEYDIDQSFLDPESQTPIGVDNIVPIIKQEENSQPGKIISQTKKEKR